MSLYLPLALSAMQSHLTPHFTFIHTHSPLKFLKAPDASRCLSVCGAHVTSVMRMHSHDTLHARTTWWVCSSINFCLTVSEQKSLTELEAHGFFGEVNWPVNYGDPSVSSPVLELQVDTTIPNLLGIKGSNSRPHVCRTIVHMD